MRVIETKDRRCVVETENGTVSIISIEDLGIFDSKTKQQIRPPDGPHPPADAAPKKYTAQQINKLIEQIRSGQPPQLPEGVREKPYRDPALPGMYIRLLNTGVASWVVQWKRLGRQKKTRIGDVLVLGRLEAIKAGRDLLAKMQLGLLDPHEARRERMRANKVMFATVATLFMERRKDDLRKSTVDQWKLYLTGYYFKPLHNLPIDEITREQIQTQIDCIALQSGNRAANSCSILMSVFFKWALKTGKLPAGHPNPMAGVERPKENDPRERVLTNDEIRLIWKTCDDWETKFICYQQIKASTGKAPNGRPPVIDTPRCVKLLFLTGCRRNEIGDLQWSEVDLKKGELHIPTTRTKNKEGLDTPLTDWAVQILRGIEQRPNRNGVFGQATRDGQNLTGTPQRINTFIVQAHGTPPKNWTLHDIRRTFRTRMAALGVSTNVAEALVGHVGHRTQMDRVYNRYEYWAEKRQALAMWEANLRAIIDGTAEKFARPRFGE
jgi:integrase